ncbi:hypothetical protein HRI_001383200 [Hibiscus trionum]|uniref:Calmodulin-binding domain-containing protein n=1 Tax=Hibiscus trionum TaxID=183268 RepID=A0A9W7HGQ6_HIBTR|nr:hypothetical protein HRI_001383200 [Hibiscus trionum]
MIAAKLQVEAGSDCFTESGTMSTATESRGGNTDKRMKKLRSMKLSRVPSTRKGRSSSSLFRAKLPGYAASSEQSNPDNIQASPNIASCGQVLPETSTAESGFKLHTSISRKSSMRFRRPQMKKSFGGTELKQRVKKSLGGTELKQRVKKSSSCDSSDQDNNISVKGKQQLAYPANKSLRATLGPMKILTKMASLRSKRTKKCAENSSISDPNIERATCSSTLKASKFPDHLQIKPRGNGTGVSNVCRYSYCSLHGHRHGDNPPLKRYVSMRRRAAKSQKSLKPDQSSGNVTKAVLDGDLGVAVQQIPSVPGKEGSQFIDSTESVHGESSYPNPSHVEQQTRGSFQVFKDIAVDCNGSGEQKAICDVPGTHIKIEETESINNGDHKSIHAPGCPGGGDFISQECGKLQALKMEEPASGIDSGILQTADTMAANSSTDVVENQKNFTFWKLIYRHMVTGLDAQPETQTPRPGMNSEEQVEDLHNTLEKNDSCWEISRADQAMSNEDDEASNQKLEFSQSDAIKLVQQAFDKILSEIPDHSSDEQSIVSEKTSDQELLYQKQDEDKEVSISTSSNSIQDCMVQGREEMKFQSDREIASEEVKAAQKEGKKADKQMPNSWSNLKKIIILKRFVKSLENVRNLKPKTIRYLPMEKDQEGEKIQLRRQMEKGRKNSEEWMLDHALRQVISTLAPSQKRKVAMLVQAFETVIPAENGDGLRSNALVSSTTTSVQDNNESSDDNVGGTENENGSEISPGKPLNSEMDSIDGLDQASESNIGCLKFTKSSPDSEETSILSSCKEQRFCVVDSETSGTDMKKEDAGAVDDNNGTDVSVVDFSLSELKDTGIAEKFLTDEDKIGASHDNFSPVKEDLIQRIAKEETSVHSSEVCNTDSEFGIKKKDMESSDSSNSPDQQPRKPECLEEIGEGCQPKYKVLHSPLEQSESNFTANISKSERQKYTRLWYLIYKHMVSGSATENGLQPLAGYEVQSDDASKHPKENNAYCQGPFEAGEDMIENYSTGHNDEIIKLVEEAIDEIPLPEIQDDISDNQSVGKVIPDQELPEKNRGQKEVKIITSSTDSVKENSEEAKTKRAELCSTLNSEEKILNSENVNTDMAAKGGIEESDKSKKRVQRNWSNLKKLVLLRRFVKALEKVKEFNPRGPRYLPVEPAPESEKVLLRHQNMGYRKNAEEWMLDYALQQVVAKLTPERKRRVGLLVEAFETVIPTIC